TRVPSLNTFPVSGGWMSGFADYESYDGLGLADLVRRGKVTPTELLDSAIARVEARNPSINAIVLPLYDNARRQIAEACPMGRSAVCPIYSRASARRWRAYGPCEAPASLRTRRRPPRTASTWRG